jgi:uncharacterized protein
MSDSRTALLILAAALALTAPALALADNDPTVQQIYDEAHAGHLEHAQQMIDRVLTDHPQSARAHYVAAELAAREGHSDVARNQLSRARELSPGLTFERPQAVQALEREIGVRDAGAGNAVAGSTMLAPPRSFPWLPVILLAGLVMLVITIVRRRSSAVVQYPGGAYSGAPVGAGPYAGPGGYGAPQGGGIGSGIAGGLASGLAVGAGVVAGEEIARHFLDGGHHPDGIAAPGVDAPSNDDMGGNDFGMSDGGSGWDDSGGGGGDWS